MRTQSRKSAVLTKAKRDIWQGARAGMGDSPSPPLGTLEAWWAVLVFGGNRCQVRKTFTGLEVTFVYRGSRALILTQNCGTTSVNKIDWQLLMRVYSACKKAK